MKNIKIQILGRPATGKSTIARLIQETLESHGFVSSIENEVDYPVDESTQEKRIDSVSKSTTVDIKMVQLNRDGIARKQSIHGLQDNYDY
jgi:uridine kinase